MLPRSFSSHCRETAYRWLSRVWVLRAVFTLLGVIALATIGLIGLGLDITAPEVNVAGRQRMLIQTTAKEAFRYRIEWRQIQRGEGSTAEDRRHMEDAEASLRQSAGRFRSELRVLLQGDPVRGIPSATNPRIRERLLAIQEEWSSYKDRLDRFVSEPGNHALMEEIDVASSRLRQAMNGVVMAMERQARAEARHQEYLALALLVALIILLPLGLGVAWAYRRLTLAQGRLQSVVAEIPDLVFYKDENLRYLGTNEAFQRFVGKPAEQVVGGTDYELFEPDTAESFREMDQRVLAEDQPHRSEEWVQYPDGRWAYLVMEKSPLALGDGELGVVGIGRDLTERRRAEATRDRMACLVEASPDLIGFAEPGNPPRGTYINPGGRKLLGLEPEANPGTIYRFHSDWAAQCLRDEAFPTAREQGCWNGETELVATDGTAIPVDQTIMAHPDDTGTVQLLSTIIHDIRPLKREEAALQHAALREETLLNHLVANLPGTFLLCDEECNIHRWNQTLATHTGLDAAALRASHPADLVPETDQDAFRLALAEALATGTATLEAGLLNAEGTAIPFQYHAMRVDWDVPYISILGLDIRGRVQLETERQNLLDEMEHMALTDPLTGISNRRPFEEALARETQRAQRYGEPFALIMLDIDHFKGINDTCGHELGDRILEELSAFVSQRLRETDLLARWGGEEFIALLPETGLAGARELAEDIRHQVAEQDFPGVGELTISLGVAEYHAYEAVKDVTKRVDEALYAAKEGGRNRVVVDGKDRPDGNQPPAW